MRAYTTIALVVVTALCLGEVAEAARRQRVKANNGKGQAKGQAVDDGELEALIEEVNASPSKGESKRNNRGNSLKVAKTERGKKHRVVRMQQYYQGLRVMGGAVAELVIDEDTEVDVRDRRDPKEKTGRKLKLSKGRRTEGDFIADIDADLGEVDESTLEPARALGKLKQKQKEDKAREAKSKGKGKGKGDDDDAAAATSGNKGKGKGKGRGRRQALDEDEGPEEVRRWDESTSTVVRLSESGTAVLNYLVAYKVAYADGTVEWPHALYDTDDVLVAKWNGMTTVYEKEFMTADGGNEKTGKRVWGTDLDKIEVLRDGTTCIMSNSFARVVDMESTTDESKDDTFVWSCPSEDVHRDGIDANGAYGVLNDALGAASLTLGTLDAWYGFGLDADAVFWPLNVARPLKVRAQYDEAMENAFFDGKMITLGNGGAQMHPLVTKDIVAHEIAHGITSAYSNLVYAGQPGGLNEAFSDMLGVTLANAWETQPESWKIGATAFKGADVLRHMDDPAADGRSLAHTSEFVCNFDSVFGNGLDVHYTSGIFNKVYYEFVRATPYGLFDGLDIMLTANMLKWTELTNFAQAAEGVMEVIDDLKGGRNPPHLPYDYSHLDKQHMLDAFATVGIACEQVTDGIWSCTDRSSAAPILALFGYCPGQ